MAGTIQKKSISKCSNGNTIIPINVYKNINAEKELIIGARAFRGSIKVNLVFIVELIRLIIKVT